MTSIHIITHLANQKSHRPAAQLWAQAVHITAVRRPETTETQPMMERNGWLRSPSLAEEHFAPKLGTDTYTCTAECSWLRVALKVVVTLCAGLRSYLESSNSKLYGYGRSVPWPCGPF